MRLMTPSLTLDTEISLLNRGFEQSKQILLASSDLPKSTSERFDEQEMLEATLGWLTVGNYSLARSGLTSLINKPAFGWACGAYVAWTGDDYILTEMDDSIKAWKRQLKKDTSFSSVYRNLGSRALAKAYHSRRDTRSAECFEKESITEGVKCSYNSSRNQGIKPQIDTSLIPQNPDQLAIILGLRSQQETKLGPDQLYSTWTQLNQLCGDTDTADEAITAKSLVLASLVTSCFLLGLVGTQPDVASGRITLNPNIPRPLSYFKLQNFKMGPDAIDLIYQRKEGTHTFVMEQNRGRVPLNVVLKPNLYGDKINCSRIDGERANLEWDTNSKDRRVVTQAQLYLDEPRTVTIVTETT